MKTDLRTIDLTKLTPQQVVAVKNEMAADKFSELLQSEVFPQEQLSQNWKYAAKKAMRKATPLTCKISMIDFALVRKTDFQKGPVPLFNFAITNNAIEDMNTDELQFVNVDSEYDALAIEVNEHMKYYNVRLKELREHIQKETEEEFAAKILEARVNISNAIKD